MLQIKTKLFAQNQIPPKYNMECLEKQNPANNRLKKNMKHSKIKRSPSLTVNSHKPITMDCQEESFSQKMQMALQSTIVKDDEQPLISLCTPLKMTVYRKHKNQSGELTQLYDFQTQSTAVRSKSKMKYTLGDFNQIQQIGPYLLNVAPFSGNDYYKTEWTELSRSDDGCNCYKTSCLQEYCLCYQEGGFCKSHCNCYNCKNTTVLSKSEELIQIRRETISKMTSKRTKGPTINKKSEVLLFCRCKKTGCSKSNCKCHRSGINCSKECECFNCCN